MDFLKRAAAVRGEGFWGITCKVQAGTGSALVCQGQKLQHKLCQGVALERRAKSGPQGGSFQAGLSLELSWHPKALLSLDTNTRKVGRGGQ